MDLAPLADPEFSNIAAEMMAMSENDLVQCDDLSIDDWLRTRTSKDNIFDFTHGMAMVITTLPDANDMVASEVIFSTAVIFTGMIWDLFKIASSEKFPDFFVKMVKGFTGNMTSAVGWAILAMDRPAADSFCHHAVYKLKRMSLPMQYLPVPIYLLGRVPVNLTQRTVN